MGSKDRLKNLVYDNFEKWGVWRIYEIIIYYIFQPCSNISKSTSTNSGARRIQSFKLLQYLTSSQFTRFCHLFKKHSIARNHDTYHFKYQDLPSRRKRWTRSIADCGKGWLWWYLVRRGCTFVTVRGIIYKNVADLHG